MFAVGRSSTIGSWARVEGTPSDIDPNKVINCRDFGI